MRALITGVNGFVGSWLAEFLLAKDVEVYGTIHDKRMENVAHLVPKLHLITCDVREEEHVRNALEESSPNLIFHLAAQSRPDISWIEPRRTLETNVIGTVNLFERVRKMNIDPVILVAGSSAEYGLISPDEPPIKEDHPLLPVSPYGVSKVAQTLMAYQYFKNYGMKTIMVRIFGATGPRKTGDACSDFCKQIVKIERGEAEPVVKVGNLNVIRDLMDVEDALEAFWILVEKKKIGEIYNICSSKPLRIGDMLNKLLSFSKIRPKIEVDPKKIRPTDEPIVVGDNTKIKRECGWEPKIPFDETLRKTL
ncbi:MAG: GDP-mannose 4,6-dehydratase, partial [Candidatus Hadarchaeales archaeon]